MSVRVRAERERKNLTYCSSADPTTFRVLLIERERGREGESIDIRVVCVSNVSKTIRWVVVR